jgi:hypothetical protein
MQCIGGLTGDKPSRRFQEDTRAGTSQSTRDGKFDLL